MNIHLLAVGRLKSGPEKQLLDHYCKQINGSFSITEIDARKYSSQQSWQQQLINLLSTTDMTIFLDERGQSWSTQTLAKNMEDWRLNNHTKTLSFCIGGADGFTEDFRKKADCLLSLGAMTWPHMLARVMIVEQIYRAQQILCGHPYHRS